MPEKKDKKKLIIDLCFIINALKECYFFIFFIVSIESIEQL